MPNSFYGLPLHPLIVHATVIIIPLAALTAIMFVLWPRFRSWAGPLPTGLSLIGLILVPLSTSSGETLEKHVDPSALLERHTELADGLLPWMIAMFVLSAVAYFIHWRSSHGKSVATPIAIVVAALVVVATVGTTIQVGRIGHAGAKASWADTNMNGPTNGAGG